MGCPQKQQDLVKTEMNGTSPRNVGDAWSWVWVLFRTTQASRLSNVCVWGGGVYYVLRVGSLRLESFLMGFALGLPYPLYPLYPPLPPVCVFRAPSFLQQCTDGAR